MLKVDIWAENFRCAGIFLLQWQVENFAHRQDLKFPTFNLLTVPIKIPYLQKGFYLFSKAFLHLKHYESGNLGRKFQVRRYLTFAMARWKLSPSTRFEIFHFQHVNCPSKNPISPKLFNRFSKTLLHLKHYKSGDLGRKFYIRSYFTFAMTMWKLSPSTGFEIFHFQHINCPSKNPISPKVFNRFSKALLHLKCVESGHLGRKFQMHWYFTFATASWKLSPSPRFEISHFQPVNSTNKNPISPKGFLPIFKSFPSSQTLWKWAFRMKISVPQVFYFCNGKVKT